MNKLFNILLSHNKTTKISQQLKKKVDYMNMLSKKITFLNNSVRYNSFKKWSFKNDIDNRISKNFLVVYIITISFLKANTTIHVSDVKGNVKTFYNSGSVNLNGKQKRQKVVAIFRLLKLVVNNASFLYNTPVALHLNNVTRYKYLIIKKLKQYFLLKSIREFNQVSYNGCRKPKVRRKKFRKSFKKNFK